MQGEVELRSRVATLKPSLIWIKAVGIEDGNYETVTTRMQPSVETLLRLASELFRPTGHGDSIISRIKTNTVRACACPN